MHRQDTPEKKHELRSLESRARSSQTLPAPPEHHQASRLAREPRYDLHFDGEAERRRLVFVLTDKHVQHQ